MEKIQGWDEAPAYTGETQSLPAGLYHCIIKQVNVQKDRNNNEQLIICFDISDGEYKGFYQKQFDLRKQNSIDVKWGGIHRQFTHDKGLPFFKGMICSIEKSNNGYRWDWNEKGLVGKLFGGVFGREEFATGDGEKKMATKLVQIRSLEGLNDAKIPEDKLLNESTSSKAPATDSNGFMNIPEGIDEELPFM